MTPGSMSPVAAEISSVLDFLRAHHEKAGRCVNDTAGSVLAAFQCGRDDQRLDTRARFKDVGNRAISIALRNELRTVVRVVGRLVNDRQHLARLDVENND